MELTIPFDQGRTAFTDSVDGFVAAAESFEEYELLGASRCHGYEFPTNTLADAQQWAATLDGPSYVLDEQSAIVAADGRVEVVSQGEWHHFPADS